jgi:hypothetical protein
MLKYFILNKPLKSPINGVHEVRFPDFMEVIASCRAHSPLTKTVRPHYMRLLLGRISDRYDQSFISNKYPIFQYLDRPYFDEAGMSKILQQYMAEQYPVIFYHAANFYIKRRPADVNTVALTNVEGVPPKALEEVQRAFTELGFELIADPFTDDADALKNDKSKIFSKRNKNKDFDKVVNVTDLGVESKTNE